MVKALVVEGEADIRHLLVDQLKDKGFQVRKGEAPLSPYNGSRKRDLT
tara:strand:+ start:402 stop:545 length:144 start_codon:yes stop_codon:yes gene_type:complete